MDVNKVREILIPYLHDHNLELYDVSFVKEFGYLILRVLVDKKGGIDVDTLAEVNDYLSLELDSIDQEMPEYMLEVSSPGAEKELRTKSEVLESVNQYIHVEIENMIYEGFLIDFSDDILTLKINIKGRIKNIKINYDEVKKIRLAVKL